jgi:hypothetical protein
MAVSLRPLPNNQHPAFEETIYNLYCDICQGWFGRKPDGTWPDRCPVCEPNKELKKNERAISRPHELQ